MSNLPSRREGRVRLDRRPFLGRRDGAYQVHRAIGLKFGGAAIMGRCFRPPPGLFQNPAGHVFRLSQRRFLCPPTPLPSNRIASSTSSSTAAPRPSRAAQGLTSTTGEDGCGRRWLTICSGSSWPSQLAAKTSSSRIEFERPFKILVGRRVIARRGFDQPQRMQRCGVLWMDGHHSFDQLTTWLTSPSSNSNSAISKLLSRWSRVAIQHFFQQLATALLITLIQARQHGACVRASRCCSSRLAISSARF